MSGADVYEKIRLGAHVCQIYTGWIYGGPYMIPAAMQEVASLMSRDGVRSITELRGAAHG